MKLSSVLTQLILSFGLLSSCSSSPGITYYNNGFTTTLSPTSLRDLSRIEIQTQSIPIYISQTERDSLHITLESNLSLKAPKIPLPQIRKRNQKLYISLEGCSLKNRKDAKKIKSITISLPTNYRKMIIVKSRSGNINTTNLKLENLSVFTTTGTITIDNNLISKTVVVKSTSGNKVIRGSAKDIIVKGTSSDLNMMANFTTTHINSTKGHNKIKVLKEFNKLSVTSTNGDIELTTLNDFDFQIKTTTISGKVILHHEQASDKSDNIAQLKTTSGNIKVIQSTSKLPNN